MPTTPPPHLPSQRALFDIPAHVAYFNCAYMSPTLRTARAAGERGVGRKAAPWQITAHHFFDETEAARAAFARLIGATADDIALVPSATYGTTTAAAALPLAAGDAVLVLDEEFPANYYPWARRAREVGARLVSVARPADGDWTAAVLAQLDRSVRIAALPHCRWDDGARLDLTAIAPACRAHGAALVLDATQSAGALPLDVAALDPDFVAVAAYKWLLGPYATGFLYVAPRWHDRPPLEESWSSRAGAEQFHNLVRYTDAYQAGARRFDMSEHSSPILLPMVIAGLDQLAAWGVPSIARTLGAITDQLAGALSELGCRAVPAAHRAPHILGVRLPAHAPADLAARLAADEVHVSRRGDAMRIAPHLHVTPDDVDRLIGAVRRALAASPS